MEPDVDAFVVVHLAEQFHDIVQVEKALPGCALGAVLSSGTKRRLGLKVVKAVA